MFIGFLFVLLCGATATTIGSRKLHPRWMEENFQDINNLTLKQLTLPGTHDSGSWSVTDQLIGVPEWIDTMEKVAEILGIPVGDIIIGWAKSQTQNFYDQFMFGIRYVDLRIVFDTTSSPSIWKTHHGAVLGAPLEVVFQHTQAFLQQNTKEVIVMELSHQSATNSTTEQMLIDLINKYIGKYLWPYSKGFVPLQQMIDAGKNVVLTLPFGNNNDYIWPDGTIINSYANSPVLPTMESFNENMAQQFSQKKPDSRHLFKMSWTLTPNVETILEMIIPGRPHSLLELADIANKDLTNWFNTKIHPKNYSYPILGNVLIIDDCSNSAIIEIVAQMNSN